MKSGNYVAHRPITGTSYSEEFHGEAFSGDPIGSLSSMGSSSAIHNRYKQEMENLYTSVKGHDEYFIRQARNFLLSNARTTMVLFPMEGSGDDVRDEAALKEKIRNFSKEELIFFYYNLGSKRNLEALRKMLSLKGEKMTVRKIDGSTDRDAIEAVFGNTKTPDLIVKVGPEIRGFLGVGGKGKKLKKRKLVANARAIGILYESVLKDSITNEFIKQNMNETGVADFISQATEQEMIKITGDETKNPDNIVQLASPIDIKVQTVDDKVLNIFRGVGHKKLITDFSGAPAGIEGVDETWIQLMNIFGDWLDQTISQIIVDTSSPWSLQQEDGGRKAFSEAKFSERFRNERDNFLYSSNARNLLNALAVTTLMGKLTDRIKADFSIDQINKTNFPVYVIFSGQLDSLEGFNKNAVLFPHEMIGMIGQQIFNGNFIGTRKNNAKGLFRKIHQKGSKEGRIMSISGPSDNNFLSAIAASRKGGSGKGIFLPIDDAKTVKEKHGRIVENIKKKYVKYSLNYTVN